jgi:hypothetical protein
VLDLAGVPLVALCMAGCGYFASGTWNDDPRNWSRAFDTVKPPEVVVVHSTYSRFPHWTYEYEYYFVRGRASARVSCARRPEHGRPLHHRSATVTASP